MKHLLLTTIAVVLLVGCGKSQSPEPPTAKAPDISIHEAAEDGNIEAVKQHIAAGTDLNAKNEVARGVGETPLHKAATRGEKEIVELLITAGADVNAKINGVVTPLDWARIGRHTEISDLLRKHGGKSGAEYSIQYAITTGNIEAVKQHIAAGADVNAKTKRGDTPLDTAISRKHPEIVNLLRKHGGKTKVELKAEGK